MITCDASTLLSTYYGLGVQSAIYIYINLFKYYNWIR